MKITKEQIQILKNNFCDIEYILKFIEEDEFDKILNQQFIDTVMPPTTRFGADGKNPRRILAMKIFKELQEITDYKIRTYFDEEDLKLDSTDNLDIQAIKENRLF